MSLIPNDKFESETASATTAPAPAVQVQQAPAPQASTAVAPAPAAQVAVSTVNPLAGAADPFGALKDAMRVDFNTLAQVQPNQGQFMVKEDTTTLGDTITLHALSWQDNWVVGPNDDNADKELVKYSDDGVTAKDGTNLHEHLRHLQSIGYDKARLQQRMVLVGAVVESAKDHPLRGQLIQLDLAPTSKAQFDRMRANAVWAIKSGTRKADAPTLVKMEAKVNKGKGNNTYTVANCTAV